MRPFFVVVAILSLTACASTTPATTALSVAPTADIPRQFDAGGRITRVHWTDEGLYFTRLGERYFYDLASGALVTDPDEPERVRAGVDGGHVATRRPV